MRLRSVDLRVTQAAAAAAAEFLEKTWGLLPAGTAGKTRFFRGTGDHPYVLSIAEAAAPAVAAITLAASPEELSQVKARAKNAGAPLEERAAFEVPGGGRGLVV